jgi:signal peptidase II
MDRISSGTVIDFLNVGVGSLRTGIFNVADMAITLGSGIIVVSGYRSDTRG